MSINRSFRIQGLAGTGKSYTLKNTVIKQLQDSGIDFIALAPTHKAAISLSTMLGGSEKIEVHTTAKALLKYDIESTIEYNKRMVKVFKGKFVVIDEVALMSIADLVRLYYRVCHKICPP